MYASVSSRQIPGFVPSELCLVEQNPHQLRHRHGRMRIVELNRNFVGKRAPIGVAASKPSYNIGKRACNEKILLHEPQSLPQACRIVWIQHSRQRFGGQLLRKRTDEIAVAEFLEVKVIRRGGGPESK